VLASASQKLRQRRSELEHELRIAAEDRERQLTEVAAESASVLAQARRQAEAIVAEAQEATAGHHDRAERRLAEAEAGARAVREQVAEQVGNSQREMYELRRTAKAAAGLMVSDAKAEADESRALAHQLLAEARAEVAVLTERRDALTAELTELSRAIDALASSSGPSGSPHQPEANRYRTADIHLAHEPAGQVDEIEDIDGTSLFEQIMRAANDPDRQRALPDGHA
jgi:ElaB/YqjD/DUF883 family membrane-anchored ribosome-binding protein